MKHFPIVLILLSLGISAMTQADSMRISYGYVVGVERLPLDTRPHTHGGALIGGLLGLWSGEGQSGSNKALRALGGAAIGSAIGRSAAQDYVYRYVVDVGNQTMRTVLIESSGFHMGDCVAIEHGRSANLRRVAPVFCEREMPRTYQKIHIESANACEQAKRGVLDAKGEEAIEEAALKMRVLCQD